MFIPWPLSEGETGWWQSYRCFFASVIVLDIFEGNPQNNQQKTNNLDKKSAANKTRCFLTKPRVSPAVFVATKTNIFDGKYVADKTVCFSQDLRVYGDQNRYFKPNHDIF